MRIISMRNLIYTYTRAMSVMLAVTALMASCADTERYISPYDDDDDDDDIDTVVVVPTYDEVLSMWELMLPSAGFADVTEVVPTDTLAVDYDDYIENQDFKASRTVTITWQGNDVTIDNTQASKGVIVTAQGAYVTITNLESEDDADDARGKVTYCLQGNSDDGQLKIYSQKKFMLQLNGLQLTCATGPAINIQRKKRCFINCAAGTDNVLQDAATYASDDVPTGEDEKACLFSEGQLIFCGTGSLTVNGMHQHGIASDEYIRVHAGCRISICSSPKDAIHTKQQYQQTGGLVRAYCVKDALQSDSLGIAVTAGYLYLSGTRCLTANGGGAITVTEPAQVTQVTY